MAARPGKARFSVWVTEDSYEKFHDWAYRHGTNATALLEAIARAIPDDRSIPRGGGWPAIFADANTLDYESKRRKRSR